MLRRSRSSAAHVKSNLPSRRRSSLRPANHERANHWLYFPFVLSLTIATLSLGVWAPWITFARALSVALFGVAMAISFETTLPLDHSALAASTAAALLVLHNVSTVGTR